MDFLLQTFLDKPVWMWMSFLALVLVLLILDLGVFHRKTREIGVRESLAMSAFYIVIGLAFGIWVWHALGARRARNISPASWSRRHSPSTTFSSSR